MSAELDNLAFQFFKLFAQYEYALKVMGYGKAGRNRKNAEADWDRFANEIGRKILVRSDPKLVKAYDYLFKNLPKRQIWRNNAVEWEIVPDTQRNAQDLFAHIRRVRNNLYHGGKFNGVGSSQTAAGN